VNGFAGRDSDPGKGVGDREHEWVVPAQTSAPRHPPRDHKRGRHAEDHDPDNPLGRLGLDRIDSEVPRGSRS
jgi:hypothetical protein